MDKATLPVEIDNPVKEPLELKTVGYLPNERDNCAVALQFLAAGTRIRCRDETIQLRHSVLTGHRFAVRTIEKGSPPLSWGMPFGIAIGQIQAGDYICNDGVLAELRTRALDFELPDRPNIRDAYEPFQIDEARFTPAEQVERTSTPQTFAGFHRAGDRGVGTRNYIVVLGTSSRTSSLARAIATRFESLETGDSTLDGVVAVSHTEGGTAERPNNADFVVRTLAGFLVHPNVGAVLAIDDGSEWVSNQTLQAFLRTHEYPIEHVLHRFLTAGDFETALAKGSGIVQGWLEPVGRMSRSDQPASALNLALQCGGSDAFSGISANPLIGQVAREVVRQGGVANLAETPELVGAEAYVLNRVRDLETARRFLTFVEEFKERMSWHGHSPEGNPSGGNRFRGLYNITIKSLGAALKRPPDVRLDYVIDYSERIKHPGYYFMNSPGNDLESIAGQVASGANIIYFTTGNGSITNFPFVPTIKVLSTTGRYEMLSGDIDLNAGKVLEGSTLESESSNAFDLTLRVASSEKTLGEKARHHQVSLWRDWQQQDPSQLITLQTGSSPAGQPLDWKAPALDRGNVEQRPGWEPEGFALEIEKARSTRIPSGLILPTSLCSSRVARTFADELNRNESPPPSIYKFVGLDHTEGCGVSGGHSQEIFTRILMGYLLHPLVGYGVLLEHGCEKVHNEYLRRRLTERGIPAERFGWASIQLDGGIEAVRRKVRGWFHQEPAPVAGRRPIDEVRPFGLGVISSGEGGLIQRVGWLEPLIESILAIGGTVVLLSDDPLLTPLLGRKHSATLEYAASPPLPGLQIMESVSRDWTESLTGLGAAGVEVILAVHHGHGRQGNPLVPTLAIGSESSRISNSSFDHRLDDESPEAAPAILDLVVKTVAQQYVPINERLGNVDFQVSRGPLGVSV